MFIYQNCIKEIKLNFYKSILLSYRSTKDNKHQIYCNHLKNTHIFIVNLTTHNKDDF